MAGKNFQLPKLKSWHYFILCLLSISSIFFSYLCRQATGQAATALLVMILNYLGRKIMKLVDHVDPGKKRG
jgi:hypothetical protein